MPRKGFRVFSAPLSGFLSLSAAIRATHPHLGRFHLELWSHYESRVEREIDSILRPPYAPVLDREGLRDVAKGHLLKLLEKSDIPPRRFNSLIVELRRRMLSKAFPPDRSQGGLVGIKIWSKDPRGLLPDYVHAFYALPRDRRLPEHPAVGYLKGRYDYLIGRYLDRFKDELGGPSADLAHHERKIRGLLHKAILESNSVRSVLARFYRLVDVYVRYGSSKP